MRKQIAPLVQAMVQFDKGDKALINHFLKVYAYAKTIGELEKLSERTQEILEVAAVTHDIGIPPSLEKYGSAAGPYQEKEGALCARPMLEELGYDAALIDRVCHLIGHHHTYTQVEGDDYQILIEADFLVNLHENEAGKDAVASARTLFRTKAGLDLLDTMFK